MNLKLSLALRVILIFMLVNGLFEKAFVSPALAASSSISTSPLDTNRPTGKSDVARPILPIFNPSAASHGFAAGNILLQTGYPSTGVLDNFNRANGSIGTNWGGIVSGYAIANSRMDVNSGSDIYWAADYFGVDQEVYVTLTSIDLNADEICLELKAQSHDSIDPGQIAVVYNPAGNAVQVWTYSTAQGWVAQGSSLAASYTSGDTFGARALANGQVEVYRNSTLLGTRSVTSWPYYAYGGYIGLFHLNAGNTLLDDFGGGTMSGSATLTPTPGSCTDPTTCTPVNAIPALWRCNIAECTGSDWVGAVVAWPSWSAYQSNGRTGNNSRSVYTSGNQALYPYMGSWADGCQVTAVSGVTLIIEWRRGTDRWRETYLDPGQSHTIDLVAAEDGALIESPDGITAFSVLLDNCNPQNIFGGTVTATPSPSHTPTPSSTTTPTFTPSNMPTNTATATFTPSSTSTATYTPTGTSTFTPTSTPSNTPTATFTPSSTSTPTFTPTSTQTFTFTPTKTSTATITPSSTSTPNFTPTHTSTATFTPIVTPTTTLPLDTIPPIVKFSTRVNTNPNNLVNVDFLVTFSESVSQVDITDFSLATIGVTGASITSVSGNGYTYNVKVNTGAGNGTIRLDVVDENTIIDAAGNPLGGVDAGDGNFTSGQTYTIKKTPTFSDVPVSNQYFTDIEILYANGLTGGCATTPLKFCPNDVMNRGQAAVFMLRGNFGSGFVPNPPQHIFIDDWKKGTWAEPWAEAMYSKGLSAGCLTSPLKYCPWDQIPREQAVIFALRLKYGNNYTPPPATGTLLADMTDVGYYATSWAEQAYKDGLIPPCGSSESKPKICPREAVSRGLGAYMIVRAKNLTMP